MTISATALIRASLSKPKSIIAARARAGASAPGLGVDVDGARVECALRADLLRGRGRVRGRGSAVANAIFEALSGATEIRAHVLQLLGAEDQHDDEKHDQPVPDAE